MSSQPISVNDKGLKGLREVIDEAGESYKLNLSRICSLMEQIKSGDIQGDPADDLLNLFKEKEQIFRMIARIIDEAEEYMGLKHKKFSSMISDLEGSMR